MTTSPLTSDDRLERDFPYALLAVFGFGLLWLWQVLTSEGFLEADACTHYLIARFAFAEPYRFVDIWGRPLKTLLYAPAAWAFGRVGVQATSLLLAAGCGYIAMLLGRDLGLKRPVTAMILTLGMPLVFLHSFSELTELPFAFLLVLAFYLHSRQRHCVAALLTGLLPLARPEGFGFVLLAAGVLVARKHFKAVLFLPVGLLGWSYFGWEAYGRDGPFQETHTFVAAVQSALTWIPRHWPYSKDSVYTESVPYATKMFHLVKFPLTLPAISGPFVFPGLLLGIAVLAQRGWKAWKLWEVKESGSRTWLLSLGVLAVPMAVLCGHSLLYFLGKMATNGELRYMLVVAPFWGIVAAMGCERLFEILRRSPAEAVRFAGYATLIPLFVNFYGYRTLPIRFDSQWETTRFISRWAADYGKAHSRPAIMAAHPGVPYFLDRTNVDSAETREFVTRNIVKPPPGTLLLYDPMYTRFNSSRDRKIDGVEELLQAGWVMHPYMTIGGWRVFLSPSPERRAVNVTSP